MTLPRFRDALSRLNQLQGRGSTLSSWAGPKLTPREKTLAWLEFLQIDLGGQSYLHIAGTKGKGTTCLYTEDLIRAHPPTDGRREKVGCMTKPHVTTVRERIRIDSEPISEECFAAHFWALWPKMERAMSDRPQSAENLAMPRYPGFLTLLAFYVFSQESVDVAILETGVGGETDSTNALASPVATGITEIGLDHVHRLGSTLDQIGWHKAGIMKSQVPAFSVPQAGVVEAVLRERAKEKCTDIHFVNDDFIVVNGFKLKPDYEFQRYNAALALQLAETYLSRSSSPRQINIQAAKCLERTSLPARFEQLDRGQVSWVLSIAHNNMSVDTACQMFLDCIGRRKSAKLVLMFSHNYERDSDELLSTIHRRVCHIGGLTFDRIEFCLDILDANATNGENFLDLRKGRHESEIVCQRHARTWERLGGRGEITLYSTVKQTIMNIEGSSHDTVVFVVGSPHLAAMARHLLSRESPESSS